MRIALPAHADAGLVLLQAHLVNVLHVSVDVLPAKLHFRPTEVAVESLPDDLRVPILTHVVGVGHAMLGCKQVGIKIN